MAQLFQHQLQPFEENQSPSPSHEIGDPFGLAPARSRSITHRSGTSAGSNTSPVKTLHRQLSGDPDAPPPAWKRRESFAQRSPPASGGAGVSGQAQGEVVQAMAAAAQRSPSQCRSPRTSPTSEIAGNGSPARPNLLPPSSSARRPPNLQMTTSTRSSMPNGMFTHESPNASSTSLSGMAYDPTFAPPQPAFLRKRGGGSGSNRSSVHSMDTNGMTSEDLWNLESSESVADLSNPQRNAMERPLDTVRRLSQRSERPKSLSPYSSSGLPIDLIWPTAPLIEDEPPAPRIKSKSTTNVSGLASRQSRLGRRKTKRQSSIEAQPQVVGKVVDVPLQRSESEFLSSAHSSTTDLSKGIPQNKSNMSLGNRPPSAYYSRDFLSQLAPREGGYAIAAMLNSPTAQSPQEDKRRSVIVGSRPPTSRSAGMGRWSLDGGEHYSRPYGSTSSANTTTSNLSAPPINSPDPSPPADDRSSTTASYLPEGASPPVTAPPSERSGSMPIPLVANTNTASTPNIPSPLSRSVTDDLHVSTASTSTAEVAPIPVPPIPANPPAPTSTAANGPASAPATAQPTLSPKKSKKELAKEAKAAEKAETAKLVAARAAKVKEEAAKRSAEKEKEKAAREAAKVKDKEEKERRKLEKKNARKGLSEAGGPGEKLKSPSQPSLTLGGLLRSGSDAPPVPAAPSTASGADKRPDQASSTSTSATAVDVRSPAMSKPLPPLAPNASAPPARGSARHVSMPTGQTAPSSTAEPKKIKLGLFGTLRKRFLTLDTSSRKTLAPTAPAASAMATNAPPAQPAATAPHAIQASIPDPAPVPSTPKAAPSSLPPGAQTPTLDAPQRQAISKDVVSTPPRPAAKESAAGSPRVPNIPVSTPVQAVPPTPVRSEDLPPRSTSVHTASPSAAPAAVVPHAHVEGPSSPSPSRTPIPPSSTDSHSPSISRSRSRSIQGPRPMPRPASVTARSDRSPRQSAPTQVETASGSEFSSGLSQTTSHMTSSTGTYDTQGQTPMTSEEAYSLGKQIESTRREATPVGMAH